MNILTVSGGGIRGIIACRLLLEIERIAKIPITQLFDFMSGTSVGTLIITAISLGEDNKPIMNMEELYNLFLNKIPTAFSWTYYSYLSSIFGLYGPKYTNIGLCNIINEVCKDKQLKHLLTNICYPAYDKITSKAYYFDNIKDKDLYLKDVILSCTAAPTYFPSINMTINNVNYDFIDGGIVVNNTAELALLHATKDLTIIDKSKILEVCIGTGKFDYGNFKEGLIPVASVIVDLIMRGGSDNELYELSLSLPKDNYIIMDLNLDPQYDYMDTTNPKIIKYYIDEAEKWINNNKEQLNNFCDKLKGNKNL